MAAAQQRELVRASAVIARMAREAEVMMMKDQTTSGPLQDLSLDAKSLLEVRIRAEILKVREALQARRLR